MHGVYDFRLVALSVAIAMLAAYAALDLASRVTSVGGKTRVFWLFGGATAMGSGIWAMHYVGMLAFAHAHAGFLSLSHRVALSGSRSVCIRRFPLRGEPGAYGLARNCFWQRNTGSGDCRHAFHRYGSDADEGHGPL